MPDLFAKLFSIKGFMPHGMCFQWRPEILWLHVISDLIVAIAYFSIPLVLVVLLYRRQQIPFKWLVILFASFILLCGATHLVSIVVLWNPLYQLQGLMKLATAAVSIATAVILFPLLPRLLSAVDDLEKRTKSEMRVS